MRRPDKAGRSPAAVPRQHDHSGCGSPAKGGRLPHSTECGKYAACRVLCRHPCKDTRWDQAPLSRLCGRVYGGRISFLPRATPPSRPAGPCPLRRRKLRASTARQRASFPELTLAKNGICAGRQNGEGGLPSPFCLPDLRVVDRTPPSGDGDRRPRLKKGLGRGVGKELLSAKAFPRGRSPLISYCGAAALLSLSPLAARRLR